MHESHKNLYLYKRAYHLTIHMHSLVHCQPAAFVDGNCERVLITRRFNTLWPCDAICLHRIRSALAQVLTCVLTPSSHYLNQFWLFVNEALWHWLGNNVTSSAEATVLHIGFDITLKLPRHRPGYFLQHCVCKNLRHGAISVCYLTYERFVNYLVYNRLQSATSLCFGRNICFPQPSIYHHSLLAA